jgi:hypothetical protein
VHASRQDSFYGPEGDSFGWFAQTWEFAFLLAAIQGYPELAVLIGRLSEAEQGLLEKAQSREADVRIVTYDEVLQRQQDLLA